MLEEKNSICLEEAKKKEVLMAIKKSSKKVCDYVKSYSNAMVLWVFISLNKQGIITFSNAAHFLKLFEKISIERILLETDSPFLAPVPLRGKKNFPENVAIIGNFLANHLKMDSEELKKITNENAEDFFKGLI